MDYEDSLIVKTAWYYYIENMTQQKISVEIKSTVDKVLDYSRERER